MIDTVAAEPEVRPGTYRTVVRPHQLKRTDVYTEALGKSARNIVIEKVVYGEILYRGRLAPVLFVHGYDEKLKHKVVQTRTAWEFLEVARIGEAPEYRRAVERLNTTFVY